MQETQGIAIQAISICPGWPPKNLLVGPVWPWSAVGACLWLHSQVSIYVVIYWRPTKSKGGHRHYRCLNKGIN